MDAAERTRTLAWTDPRASIPQLGELAGLDYMRAVRDGTIPPPPMAVLINATLAEADHGRVSFVCIPGEEHYNPLGAVHGGLVCTLLDSATGCAAHTTLAAGTGYTSIEIKVNYLRPVSAATGPLTATGVVRKAGARVIFAEASVVDSDGRLVATASSSLLVVGT